jgi:hypothetical protein
MRCTPTCRQAGRPCLEIRTYARTPQHQSCIALMRCDDSVERRTRHAKQACSVFTFVIDSIVSIRSSSRQSTTEEKSNLEEEEKETLLLCFDFRVV